LVTRINGIVAIQVYRKLTHTDRYLDLRTRHDKKHKTGAVSTLSNRASNLPSTALKEMVTPFAHYQNLKE